MNNNRIFMSLLPTTSFLNEDGTFNLNAALMFCGLTGGICYSPDGFEALKTEDKEETLKRVNRTLNSGHHSLYDHPQISLEISNIPKILAMVLNNEHQYTTSEKSGRYVDMSEAAETEIEKELYNK